MWDVVFLYWLVLMRALFSFSLLWWLSHLQIYQKTARRYRPCVITHTIRFACLPYWPLFDDPKFLQGAPVAYGVQLVALTLQDEQLLGDAELVGHVLNRKEYLIITSILQIAIGT
jgi:hypothetical protein